MNAFRYAHGAILFAVCVAMPACSSNNAPRQRAADPNHDQTPQAGSPEPAPKQHTAKVQVFADDVDTRSLPASLSIETLGGVSTLLIPRGTPLPAERTENFSTASGNQTSVAIHPFIGDHPMASDNVSLGTFTIVDIPPAPRGTPSLDIVFRIDAGGVFTLSAMDTHTDTASPITSSGSPPPLTKATVERMFAAAGAE